MGKILFNDSQKV